MSRLPSYTPMLATLGSLPPESEDDDWAYEMKWDGVRALAYVEDGGLRLISRNQKDMSPAYPELEGLADALDGRNAVLDGEIVAFDEQGRPSFERLQPRIHQRQQAKIQRLVESTPVTFLAFDLLQLDDERWVDSAYEKRRRALADLRISGDRWDTPPHHVGNGAEIVARSLDLQLEGVMAKRLGTTYRPGRRVDYWVKVKNIRTQEVVVVGWKPGSGRRSGMIGSLLLAVNSDGRLVYAGNVGTGFSEQMLRDLADDLEPLARKTSPFQERPPAAETRDAHWVGPKLVGEVAYSERTRDGRLRHPAWRGLRPDKSPADVEWE